MFRTIGIILCSSILLCGCDGGYSLTGHVYEEMNGFGVPLDSVSITVLVDNDWLRGQTFSDSTGSFKKMALSTPFKAPYMFIFEKAGYKTDTVRRQGEKGHTDFAIDHYMKKLSSNQKLVNYR